MHYGTHEPEREAPGTVGGGGCHGDVTTAAGVSDTSTGDGWRARARALALARTAVPSRFLTSLHLSSSHPGSPANSSGLDNNNAEPSGLVAGRRAVIG